MKLAILFTNQNAMPSIFHAEAMSDLLDQLRAVRGAPDLPDEAAAREWLATLHEPSGLFLSMAEAKAHLARVREARSADLTPEDVQGIRDELKMSRADFADAIGFGGNTNTRHKLIWEVENGRKPITQVMASKIRALAAEGRLQLA